MFGLRVRQFHIVRLSHDDFGKARLHEVQYKGGKSSEIATKPLQNQLSVLFMSLF